MMTLDISEYENLIDKIIYGNFTAEDVQKFVENTPILPILAKTLVPKNKAVVEVVVTDKKGMPVNDASVTVGGQTKTTDVTGKVTFEFDYDVPPGFIIVKKGSAINRIPFNGVTLGQKATIATVLCAEAESPVAVGESLKDVINTYYQWQLIQNIEKGVFRPELSGMPQVGILQRKSDHEYQVYIPVPVNIKVPEITFQPMVGMPGQPPVPIQQGYTVVVNVEKGENAQDDWKFEIVLKGITNPAFIKMASGGYGTYTFKGVPAGEYVLTITGPNGITTKNITVSNKDVSILVPVSGVVIPPPTHENIGNVVVKVIPERKEPQLYGMPAGRPPRPINIVVSLDALAKRGGYGTYTFKNIPVGPHRLIVTANGTVVYDKMIQVVPQHTAMVTVSIKSETTAPPTPPPMPPAPPTTKNGVIRVVVNNRGRQPVVVSVDNNPQWTKSIVSGPVLFKNIPQGAHHVIVKKDSETIYSKTIDVVPNMVATVVVNVPSAPPTPPPMPPPTAKGTLVVDVIGKPTSPPTGGIGIRLLALAVPKIDVYVDGKHQSGGFGNFTFTNLPEGTHNVKVYADGKLIYNSNVYIKAGETKRISVEYKPTPSTGTLVISVTQSGSTTPPGGTTPPKPTPPGASVSIHGAPSPTSETESNAVYYSWAGPLSFTMTTSSVIVEVDGTRKTGDYGKYTFANLNPGRHHLRVYVNGKLVADKYVNVEPNKTVTVPVVVPGTTPTPPQSKGSIALNVIRGPYAPARPNITVFSGKHRMTITSYGRRTFSNIPAGVYNVKIIDNITRKIVNKTVEVKPGRVAVINYTVVGKPPSGTPPGGTKPIGGTPVIRVL